VPSIAPQLTRSGLGRRIEGCPRCGGGLIPDLDGLACLCCGHVVYSQPALDIDIPDADGGHRQNYFCTADDGCDKPPRSGGLCAMHEFRVRRHGDAQWERPSRRSA